MIESIRGGIWKSKVNSGLGILFVGSFALWAGTIVIETAWHINPIANAFTSAVERTTTLPENL